MKASELEYRKDLRLTPDTGQISFKDSRLILLDVNSLGILRENVISRLGAEQARAIMLQFGYQSGFSDYLQVKSNYTFDNEEELLISGFNLMQWEGLAKSVLTDVRFSHSRKELQISGQWLNSYEAEQHLIYHHENSEGVCWSLAGYVSGWCTAFLDTKVIAVERMCVGKGDPHCEWIAKPANEWGIEAHFIIDALKEF